MKNLKSRFFSKATLGDQRKKSEKTFLKKKSFNKKFWDTECSCLMQLLGPGKSRISQNWH